MEELTFRECGGCAECCSGKLIGNAYGNLFQTGKHCVFLVKQKCVIYDTRPDTCRKYQCAWSQGIVPIEMKPNECGFLISVEVNKEHKQFLKIVTDANLNEETVEYFDQWCKNNNTYYEVIHVNKA